ncbi:hypothetical protein CANINC_004551 [Pichia inconspicua]|uniref:Elongator complex protein 2 n=1 Tax=Pichia inconspicua TaxID=52247 RepID=A0A4T0WX45_9ASCO|nr:hypothetical protein CANINC_004551 [[Candida] inconspicua]
MSVVEGIFAGCNRNLAIFDYDYQSKVLAYGSANTVSVTTPIFNESGYDIGTQVVATLKHHTRAVSCVKWLHKSSILLSACEGGVVNLWKRSKDGTYTLLQGLKPTEHAISGIGLVTNDDKCFDFVVADSKGMLFYYSFESDVHRFMERAQIELPFGYYAMGVNILRISETEMVIVTGGSKPVLQVLTFDKMVNLFVLQATVPGHDDWVRSIDSREIKTESVDVNGVPVEKRRIVIATGSLDRIIRLWNLTVEDVAAPVYVETNKLKLLTSKEFKFTTLTKRYVLSLDAILMGHDDWVSEVSWKEGDCGMQEYNSLQLVSSSADSSVMVWQPDQLSGVWFPETRLGEIAIKGASTATGSSGGFYCSKWIADDKSGAEIVLSNGKTGSFRCWVKQIDGSFERKTCLTGPVRGVTDISWSPSGEYVLATSLDQSTRLYARYKGNGKWYEFGRPQIHGYDMISVKLMTDTKFVSGGDEKVVRVFEMPRNVAEMLERVANVSVSSGNITLPEFASVPVLGLSNKANIDENDEGVAGESEIVSDILVDLIQPPVEDVLQRHTLWPECEKLYGHGFEITTLDASKDRSIVSSACRSNVAKHAVIRNFNSSTWLQCSETLAAHDLTITRLRYSLPDDDNKNEYLLAVSRDRKFSLWLRHGEEFKLIKVQEKAHSRIIWDCAWVNFGDNISFVTVSRDKEMRLWKLENDDVVCTGSVRFEESAVTAIDSVKTAQKGVFKLVVGLDNGDVYVYIVDVLHNEFEELMKIEESLLPGAGISRISICDKNVDDTNVVCIGSDDSSLRFLRI